MLQVIRYAARKTEALLLVRFFSAIQCLSSVTINTISEPMLVAITHMIHVFSEPNCSETVRTSASTWEMRTSWFERTSLSVAMGDITLADFQEPLVIARPECELNPVIEFQRFQNVGDVNLHRGRR